MTDLTIAKFNQNIDRQLNAIISFMTFHNLKSDVKFESIQAKYLNHDGRLIQTPIVVCDEVVSELEKEKVEILETIKPKTPIMNSGIEVPGAIVTYPKEPIGPVPGDVDYEPESNPVPSPAPQMPLKPQYDMPKLVNKLRDTNHPDNNKSLKMRINDFLDNCKLK